jgi:hypothetical protein
MSTSSSSCQLVSYLYIVSKFRIVPSVFSTVLLTYLNIPLAFADPCNDRIKRGMVGDKGQNMANNCSFPSADRPSQHQQPGPNLILVL